LTATQKKEISNILIPLLEKFSPVERLDYLQKISKRIEIPEEILRQFDSHSIDDMVQKAAEYEPKIDLEAEVLYYFIYYPDIAHEFLPTLSENLFSNNDYLPIVKTLKTWYNKQVNIAPNQHFAVLTFLQKELELKSQSNLQKIIASSLKKTFDESTDMRQEIVQHLDRLANARRDDQKKRFAEAIAQAEQTGDRQKVKELLQELQTFLIPGGTNGQKNS
jgi:hypothetical protein